jgi:tRNA (guanine-N(7)-)-methyltransferase subunit TRM82
LSAIVFTKNGNAILAANKFGDVLAVSTMAETVADATEKSAEFELALGHYCSVVTSLSLSADGTLLASTDRDGKVRVSVLPENPLLGAHEIQSFAFGHTDFVSCAVFVGQNRQRCSRRREVKLDPCLPLQNSPNHCDSSRSPLM